LQGAWPNDPAETGSFIDRIHAFMLKAGREAKVHSSWNDPNLEREKAMDRFIDALLRSVAGEKFREDFTRFQAFVSRCGMLNSLSQTVLKLAAPGVPDTYQGTELFDFSLVDPDNRRPVDFARRIGLMEEIEKGGRHRGELITRLLATPQTGAIKLFVHHAVLNCRRKYPGIFAGDYQALQTTGERAGNVFAFARSDGSRMAIVAVCRLVGGLAEMEGPRGWDSITWGDTAVVLPEAGATAALRDNFTGERVELTRNGGGAAVAVGGVFSRLPVCLLISE
jgi:(1->4)-alpha-D-glucan 1-alpha-D-glucosylmutase